MLELVVALLIVAQGFHLPRGLRWTTIALATVVSPANARQPAPSPIVRSEFVFERAPFPSAHASTIVETRDGLVAAWFGGTAERNPDVGIWVSRLPSTTG